MKQYENIVMMRIYLSVTFFTVQGHCGYEDVSVWGIVYNWNNLQGYKINMTKHDKIGLYVLLSISDT